jgi:ribosomal protein L18
MDKNELISKVATGILNGYNINQLIDIAKSHALFQAETHYDSLDEEGRKALEENIKAADAQIAAQLAEQNKEAPEEAPVEVVD